MDQDSMKQNRDFRFLEINEQAFLKALTNSGIAGNANILKLHQNFFIIKANFKSVPLASDTNFDNGDYRVGNIDGPYYCVVKVGDTLITIE